MNLHNLSAQFVAADSSKKRAIILNLVTHLLKNGANPLVGTPTPMQIVWNGCGPSVPSQLFYDRLTVYFAEATLVPDKAKFVALLRGVDLSKNVSWADAVELQEACE